MTAAPVPGVRPAVAATSGSTTRRAGLWQSPVVRRGTVDLAAVALLLATGVQAFGPVFGGGVGYLAAGGGATLGLAVAVLASWRRWSRLGTLLASVLAYLALGGPLALPDTTVGGLLPSVETVQRLTLLSWQSWRDLLTVSLPAGEFDGPAVLPYLVGLSTAAIAGSAALRLRRVGWVLAVTLAPACALLVVGILWGSHDAPWALVQGGVFVGGAVAWASWRSGLGRVDSHAIYFRSASAPRGARVRHLVAAGVTLTAAATLAAGVISLVAADPDRHVLRDSVTPPLDLQRYPSPLTEYRRLETDLEDEPLFTVSGLPAGARVRLAAMDVYDGDVYRVTESSAAFARSGRTIDPGRYSDPDAAATDLVFHVEGYDGVWLPGGGDLRRVAFADSSDDLSDGLYVNQATGTALVTGRVAAGADYEVSVVLPPPYPDDVRESLPSDATPDQSFPIGANTARVPAVSAAIGDLRGDAVAPMDVLRTIEQALRTQGFYANGEKDLSFPGHTVTRIQQLLDDKRGGMVGDDEQYAVAFALMARELGVPARVVLGFYPEPGAPAGDPLTITGDDAHVWVEARFEELGWVPFDPTPDDSRRPQQNTPEPEPRNEPQVLPPPDVPQDAEPKPPPRADSDVDEDDDAGGSVWRVVRIVALALGAAALAGAPFLLIAGLKARRSRRRRTSGRLADRISGGWAEVVDLATDLGVRVPPPATRFEAAILLEGRMPPSVTVPIAHRVDAHVFGAGEPTEVDAEAVWAAVDTLRAQFRESATVRDRIRQRFSLRSLVRRPAWLARAEARMTSGSSR